ncbi:uncharacterized protein E0L32_011997 [Thyridium curvatum]|uniref:Uncharacterized protein n=1 Tax=Thyridium curvatum TaxID=1093900 RepID=A0A507BGM8_9PEZI|nr:uncharacterized protein E0L32_011997 [Thyridium curvatum]TPX17934.1 hypothetical protein E0L32_011997 [Thyridium curvatum]
MSLGPLIGQLDVNLLPGAACLIDIQAIIGNCPSIVIDTHKNPNVTVVGPDTICVTTTPSLPTSTGGNSATTTPNAPCTRGCGYPTKPVNPPSSSAPNKYPTIPPPGDSTTLKTSTRRPQYTTTWCPDDETTGNSSPTSSGNGNGNGGSSTGNGGASSTGNGNGASSTGNGNGGSSTGNGGASSTASPTSSTVPTSTPQCQEPLLTLDLSLLGIDVADLKVFLDLAGLLEGLLDTVGDLLGGLLGIGGNKKDPKPINRQFQPHCGTSLGNGTTTTATDAKDCLAKCQEDGIKLTLQLGKLNDCLGATIKDGVAVDNCLYVLGQEKDILDLNAELLGDPHGTTYTPVTKK